MEPIHISPAIQRVLDLTTIFYFIYRIFVVFKFFPRESEVLSQQYPEIPKLAVSSATQRVLDLTTVFYSTYRILNVFRT